MIFDIENFDNYIEYSYNESESETSEKSLMSTSGITNITFENDKMITETVIEKDGYVATTKTV